MINFEQTTFAIIDVETTGLFPPTDRIVEVAVVRLAPNGRIEDEYVTLVNPGRDVGPTDLHGITASEVVHAPPFAEVAGDIAARLDGAVLAGHNVRFDLAFLRSEYALAGRRLPVLPAVCTLHSSWQLLDGLLGRKLCDCCEAAGITLEGAHTTLGDARATAQLLAVLARRARAQGAEFTLAEKDPEVARPGWGGPPSGKRVGRKEAQAAAATQRAFLSRIVAALPGLEATTAERAGYMALLDRVLEDRRVVPDEAGALMAMAKEWGLSKRDVEETHEAYLQACVLEARADGQVTDAELNDLSCVSQLLGIDEPRLFSMLESASLRPAQAPLPPDLRGLSVCFTGTLLAKEGGEPITRSRAEALAANAGLQVHPRVTKKLDLLVVADPNTLSGKAKTAARYGTRILAERAFWRAIGAAVE